MMFQETFDALDEGFETLVYVPIDQLIANRKRYKRISMDPDLSDDQRLAANLKAAALKAAIDHRRGQPLGG